MVPQEYFAFRPSDIVQEAILCYWVMSSTTSYGPIHVLLYLIATSIHPSIHACMQVFETAVMHDLNLYFMNQLIKEAKLLDVNFLQ
jgi:hypothetical protein